ncbi:MAG: hypothetical protein LH615_09855 [Ferruginibacter sp.]|nr:hypothetical protein [Ferruginibacter sp.]
MTSLFDNGIYLENLKIIIPWKIDYGKLINYGNPKTSRKSKLSPVKITWDSVRIINNFRVDLFIVALNSFVSKKKIKKTGEFRALIDSSTAFNITSYIVNLTGKNGNSVVNKKNKFTRCDVGICRLMIGYDKYWGHFLIISNNKL